MTRNVTITFDDGSQHMYSNVPDDATPDQVTNRASQEFSDKAINNIDGGRGSVEPSFSERLGNEVSSITNKPGVLGKTSAAADVVNRGLIANTLGAPVDLANMAVKGYHAASNAVMSPFGYENKWQPSEAPVGGGEWMQQQMQDAGVVGNERRPILETAAGLAPLAPTAIKGAVNVAKAVPEVATAGKDVVKGLYSGFTGVKPGNAVKPWEVASAREPLGDTYIPKDVLEQWRAGEISTKDMNSLKVPTSELPQEALKKTGGMVPYAGQKWQALGEQVGESYRNPYKAALELGTDYLLGGVPTVARAGIKGYDVYKTNKALGQLEKHGFTPISKEEHRAINLGEMHPNPRPVAPVEPAVPTTPAAPTFAAGTNPNANFQGKQEWYPPGQVPVPPTPQIPWNGNRALPNGGGQMIGPGTTVSGPQAGAVAPGAQPVSRTQTPAQAIAPPINAVDSGFSNELEKLSQKGPVVPKGTAPSAPAPMPKAVSPEQQAMLDQIRARGIAQEAAKQARAAEALASTSPKAKVTVEAAPPSMNSLGAIVNPEVDTMPLTTKVADIRAKANTPENAALVQQKEAESAARAETKSAEMGSKWKPLKVTDAQALIQEKTLAGEPYDIHYKSKGNIVREHNKVVKTKFNPDFELTKSVHYSGETSPYSTVMTGVDKSNGTPITVKVKQGLDKEEPYIEVFRNEHGLEIPYKQYSKEGVDITTGKSDKVNTPMPTGTIQTDYPIYKNSLLEHNIPHSEPSPGVIKVIGKDNVDYLGEGNPGLTNEMEKIISKNNKKYEYASSTATFDKDNNLATQEWFIPASKKSPSYKIIQDYTKPELELTLYEQHPTGSWKKIATDLEDLK